MWSVRRRTLPCRALGWVLVSHFVADVCFFVADVLHYFSIAVNYLLLISIVYRYYSISITFQNFPVIFVTYYYLLFLILVCSRPFFQYLIFFDIQDLWFIFHDALFMWFLAYFFRCLFPQIAGSYRGSNFSKGGIVLANWPTSGCCSECCAGCCPGCCCGCCRGCSGSCLPLGGIRVLSRVLFRVLRIMFAIGPRVLCRGAVQGAPDHVCHWAVSGCCPGCCPGCFGSCLPLGGVRAPGCCPGCCPGVLLRGAVQGAPDHVCQGAVQLCCPGCSGSRLLLGGVRVLSIQRFNLYLVSMLV